MPVLYRFSVILNAADITDDDADRLYEAGCDDASILVRNSVASLQFDREAPSLEEAIRAAVKDAESAGFAVVRIEIERHEVSARAS
jgi:hypothetical protein